MGAGQHGGEAAGRPLPPAVPRLRGSAQPGRAVARWHRGFETAVRNAVARDAFRFGLYTGMRLTEVIALANSGDREFEAASNG